VNLCAGEARRFFTAFVALNLSIRYDELLAQVGVWQWMRTNVSIQRPSMI